MTANELKEMFEQIDFNSIPDEELLSCYNIVRSKTVELNRIMHIRKHLKIRHPQKDNKTK